MSTEVAQEAAALRGLGKFSEAVALVETNLPTLDPETRLPALLQAFYAAKDGGLGEKARLLARLIAQEDQNVPSIQDFLT